MKIVGRYDFEELRAAAESGRKEDVDRLGEWLETYGDRRWNGEYYDADGLEVYPLVALNGKNHSQLDHVGFTLDRREADSALEKAVADGWEG